MKRFFGRVRYNQTTMAFFARACAVWFIALAVGGCLPQTSSDPAPQNTTAVVPPPDSGPPAAQGEPANMMLLKPRDLGPLGAAVEPGAKAFNAGDYKTAWRELTAAAKSDPQAQHLLGAMYYGGKGVAQNRKQAAVWFTKAASGKCAVAAANLGVMYTEGDGVARDKVKAFRYTEQAAEGGDLQSQYNMGQFYRLGAGTKVDLVQAAAWYKKGALRRHLPSQNNYGILCAAGSGGVKQDFVQAYAWLSLPAARGDSSAARNLAHLKSVMPPEQLAAGKKLAQEYEAQYSASASKPNSPKPAPPKPNPAT